MNSFNLGGAKKPVIRREKVSETWPSFEPLPTFSDDNFHP
jgi:hypothetical protein